MPRNSSGTYSLPAGNPVVSATQISTTWANNTLNDLKAEMTDSLSRSGKGGMSAALALFAGVVGSPGLQFSDEPTTGLYWPSAGLVRLGIQGTELVEFGSNYQKLSGTAPALRLNETDAAANNKLWDILASGEDLHFRTLTDALVGTDWMVVQRTGSTIDQITISATNITLNGYTPTITGGLAALNAANIFTSTNEFQGLVSVTGNDAILRFSENDAAANNKLWQWRANGEQFLGQTLNDALGATSWIVVDRTGATIDLVNFPGTAVTISGTLGVTGATTLGSLSAGAISATSFAGAVAATTLSASSTVSGAGFSTYLASPPAIGTTTPAGGRFTYAYTAESAITFHATAMTIDLSLSNAFRLTMTANVTTAPTLSNPHDGQTINIHITQDATGSRTMTWPSSFIWEGGSPGVLSTTANAVDLLVLTYRSTTGKYSASLIKDLK